MIQLGLQRENEWNGGAIPFTDAASLQTAADALATRLGPRFEVLGTMAIGGMAVIFRVRHRIHGGLLAAKVMHKHLQERSEAVTGFRREANHVGRLGDHPNLVPILDAGFDHDLSYHLYPFVEGEDLDRLVGHSPLSCDEAFHMAAQISSVLCHMESHGIVHGDISPGNIRVDIFGRYRLLDFGLSRDTRESLQPLRGGTPLYTSPEQIKGALPGHGSDLYALGLVLCESITGKPLIQGTTFQDIELCHCNATWSLPETIQQEPALARLLRCLLARDPSERLISAFELSGALAALGFERPEFRRQKAKVKSREPSRRSRLLPVETVARPVSGS